MALKLLTFLFFLVPLVGLSDKTESPAVKLNPAGKRRLEENKQIILTNIETSLTNAENSQKNASTLTAEIKSLKAIQEELTSLKSQYQTFLDRAQSETTKNNLALQQLRNNPDKTGKSSELSGRQSWKKDTDSKVEKVRQLLGELNRNLTKVERKVQDLGQKRDYWLERERLHQKTAQEFTQKKIETEKKLRGES
jgi:uncharacterized protein YukE